MTSLVIELQKEILNPASQAADLLRKALVITRKLEIPELEQWVNNELNGYTKDHPIPEYRFILGEVRTFNRYNGYIPVIFANSKHAEMFSKRQFASTISEIESLAKSNGDILYFPFPNDIKASLIPQAPSEPVLAIGKSSILRIIDTVKNIILDWTLKLEKQGILGENMSFSQEEKISAATTTPTLLIHNLSNSQIQIQHNSSHSTQNLTIKNLNVGDVRNFISNLQKSLSKLDLRKEQKQELEVEIETINLQISSPNPKTSILNTCLNSIKNILENVTANVFTSGLITELTKLLH